MPRETPKRRPRKGQSTDARHRGGAARSSDESPETGRSKGAALSSRVYRPTRSENEPVHQAKPFVIPKRLVREAYRRVKSNRGAAGVDGETLEEFARKLAGNLYKIWNRLSSGTYFPPPVREVEVSKRDGGVRRLGIPTVSDRIAQAVVKLVLEPEVEPMFHPDSYGYRPGKSALQAVGTCRQRCWRNDWVLDLDIKGFFDHLDQALILRAVRKVTDCRWVLLYVERWLNAPIQKADGTLEAREKGTPQGGVVSPLLANLFLHYAFDAWMQRNHPDVQFERYADDIVVHCRTEHQAKQLLEVIRQRLAECHLELHPEKTKIVYCQDGKRRGDFPIKKFDFLGYTFRRRSCRTKAGRTFLGFNPAVSNASAKDVRQTMRSWRIPQRSDWSLDQIATFVNPKLRGWIEYFGAYRPSDLYPALRHFNRLLARWAMRKHKKLHRKKRKTHKMLENLGLRRPGLFEHWKLLGLTPVAGW